MFSDSIPRGEGLKNERLENIGKMRRIAWNPRSRTWSDHNEKKYLGCHPRMRLWRTVRTVGLETRNYFDNTTLHGFKYVTAPDGSLIERLVWLMVCLMGILFSVVLMLLVWQRFMKTPTITTIDTTTNPIWSLPFPAVTICNYNKVYKPEADNLSEEFMKQGLNSTEIRNFFKSLPKLIRPGPVEFDLTPVTKVLLKLGYTIGYIMKRLMQPCGKLLNKCYWLSQQYPCSKIFKIIKSVEGYCCAFNYHAVESRLEVNSNMLRIIPPEVSESFTTETPSKWIPGVEGVQMVAGAGREMGLSVAINLETDFYDGAIRSTYGASVMIHNPQSYPEVSVRASMVQPGQEVDIAIEGNIVGSSANVRSLPVKQRQCWFDDEAELKTSVRYGYETCVTECRMEYIVSLCNCIPFYYPNVYKNLKRTCSFTDIRCMLAYRRILSSLQTPIDADEDNQTRKQVQCYCMPKCSDEWFSITTTGTTIKPMKDDAFLLMDHFEMQDWDNQSVVHIYFRDITCIKYRRDAMMTWDALLASFGGIFGLCLGGSVISLVELIYYFTAKIFHKKKYKNEPSTATVITNPGKFQSGKMKKRDQTMNGGLNNLNVFMDRIHFRSNNFVPGEVGAFTKRNVNFNVASVT